MARRRAFHERNGKFAEMDVGRHHPPGPAFRQGETTAGSEEGADRLSWLRNQIRSTERTEIRIDR